MRADYHAAGFYLRPRIFAQPGNQPEDAVACDGTSASEQSSPNPVPAYTRTETMYLKTTGAAKGVLQIHRASWHVLLPRARTENAGRH